MKGSICIDYLSFEWGSEDLIQAYKELKRESKKTLFEILQGDSSKRLKKLYIERVKQSRYENVLWRQMARSCTNKLSFSNTLIDPGRLNWQKESDITWLYGPLYVPVESGPNSLKDFQKENFILKRPPLTQDKYWRPEFRYWSKCASESGRQNVRFNPDVVEIQYMPDMPITHQPIEQEEEDDELSKFLNQFMSTITLYVKSIFLYLLLLNPHQTKKPKKTTSSTTGVVILYRVFHFNKLIDICISTITFTAWFMYQSLLSIIYRTLANQTARKSIQSTL